MLISQLSKLLVCDRAPFSSSQHRLWAVANLCWQGRWTYFDCICLINNVLGFLSWSLDTRILFFWKFNIFRRSVYFFLPNEWLESLIITTIVMFYICLNLYDNSRKHQSGNCVNSATAIPSPPNTIPWNAELSTWFQYPRDIRTKCDRNWCYHSSGGQRYKITMLAGPCSLGRV